MSRKKQIIVPLAILALGVAGFAGFSAMKKPPQEKEAVDNTPIVAIETVTVEPMRLMVDSYGVVMPKYETQLIAQVTGQIVELSETFVRGGFIKQGQLLARIDPSDYEAALIDAQATLASAQAALEQERAQGKVAQEEWKRITDSSPTELSLRKPQLAQELARVKAAEAAILRAKRNLERTEIKAPYDAMIESREIGLGSFVAMGTPLGKLLGTDIAEVRLPVADNQLQFLESQGLNADVKLSGTYAGNPQSWQANVARSEGVVDNKSRMTYLVAEIKDPYGLNHSQPPIRFGAYVTADILGVNVARASTIPSYLINKGRVPLLDKDSKLRFATIEVIRQDGSNIIVGEGLNDGDRLITSALDYPIDGMALALPSESLESESELEESAETQVASIRE